MGIDFRTRIFQTVAAPGFITRQILRNYFCNTAKIKVITSKYFPSASGEVFVHVPFADRSQTQKVIFGPALVGTLLCAAISCTPMVALISLGELNMPLTYWIFAWVGISIGMHAIPDETDIDSLLQLKETNPADAKWASTLSQTLNFINQMRRAWIDLLYAVLVALAVPTLLVNFG